jgi:mutator protein MutT
MKILEVSVGIILHPADNALLAAQRLEGAHLANLWEFPGGKCQLGETPADCVRREIREEVDLEVEVLEEWPMLEYVYPERTVHLHPFICRAASGNARPLASQRIAWIAIDDLTSYPFPEANGPWIERLQQEWERLAALAK